MLSGVQVENSVGSRLTLNLADSNPSFLITNITGLEPGKAIMVSSSLTTAPGAQYQMSRRDVRNIVFTIELRPGVAGDASELRRTLYQYLMPQSAITLHIQSTNREDLVIDGVVESFECPLFTKTPIAVISILCYDPDFRAETKRIVNFTSSTTIDYDGSIDTGILLTMDLSGLSNPGNELQITNNRSTQKFDFVYFQELPTFNGTLLVVNTEQFNKEVMLLINGFGSSALAFVSPFSNWISLEPGVNVVSASIGTVTYVPTTLEYLPRHGGL